MRGTGALARASMADLKPDRVRAAELAQTGAGRGRARGEKIEREHESTRTLFEHLNPSELSVVPSGMHSKNFVGIESLVSGHPGGPGERAAGGGSRPGAEPERRRRARPTYCIHTLLGGGYGDTETRRRRGV